MEIANGAVQLLCVNMRSKVITSLVFVSIKRVNGLDNSREQKGERKNRCKDNLKWFKFNHLFFIDLGLNDVRRKTNALPRITRICMNSLTHSHTLCRKNKLLISRMK